MNDKKTPRRERLRQLQEKQAQRTNRFGPKPPSVEPPQTSGTGISTATRAKLEFFDGSEAELTQKQSEHITRTWRGEDASDEIASMGHAVAELPRSLDYYSTLRTAAAEASGPEEKREVDARRREALYNAVVRDPRMQEVRSKAAETIFSFRYEFSGQVLTQDEMVGAWQSLGLQDPILSRTIYLEYLRQSAELQPAALQVAQTANQLSVEAARELGMEARTFADVILAHNELGPDEYKSRVAALLEASRNLGEFIDQIAADVGASANTLTEHGLFSRFLMTSGVLDVFPQSPQGSFGYLKHILDLCGFFDGDGPRLEAFGEPPHLIIPDISSTAGAMEGGALSFGKGAGYYAASLNAATRQEPIQYLTDLAHETGHVLHYAGMDRVQGPRFYKTDTPAFREGMALVTESLIAQPRSIRELGNFTREDGNLLYLTLRFLSISRMRELAIRGLTEMAMYRMAPGDVGDLYAHMLKEYPVSRHDVDISDRLHGSSWGAETMIALDPGASMNYALGYGIASSVVSSLSIAGGGSAISQTTAPLISEYCYTGSEVPWRTRIKKMLEDMGLKTKQVLQ
jgi:hypothetical protein